MTAHISDDGSGREESVAEHTEKTVYLCRGKGRRCGISHIMSVSYTHLTLPTIGG